MNRKYFANLVAFGALAVTSKSEASINPIQAVFDALPRSITQSICSEETLSLTSIHQMIAQRNSRDKRLVCSAVDKMDHL